MSPRVLKHHLIVNALKKKFNYLFEEMENGVEFEPSETDTPWELVM